MDYQAFVINLPRRDDRREHITAQTDRAGLPVRFWDGVDAADDSVAVPADFIGSRGAYGCLMAHRSLLWHVLENEPEPGIRNDLVVLEDDVVLAEDFMAGLREHLDATPRVWDVLLLGGEHHRAPTGYAGLLRCTATTRTWGYVVSAEHLERFAADLDEANREIDLHLAGRQLARIYCMPLRPLVTPADFSSDVARVADRKAA